MDQKQEEKILCENIRIFSERNALSEQQRQLSLKLWIRRLLAESDADPTELYGRFTQSLSQSGALLAEDKALFCHTLANSILHQKKLMERASFQATEVTESGSHGRIALVRNRYNEEAFSIFEPTVQGAKAEFLSSFSDACEEVFDNLCEFCILPVENTGDGRLFGFYSMLDRYELKICAICELESESSPETIRYALVGKHLPHRISKNAEWNFECCISAESEKFPYDIFRIAPLLQASIIKIDSLPILYDDNAHRIYLTFRIPKQMAFALDLYLSAEHLRYTAIGLYPIIK